MGKKQDPDHISESFETIFGLKYRYLYSLMRIRIRDPNIFDPGSGIWDGKIRIQDPG
jgi:hypothetical protein